MMVIHQWILSLRLAYRTLFSGYPIDGYNVKGHL